MAKKDFFYNSVKAKNLLILTAVLILSLAFSSKSEQNQKEQKVQKLVLSEDCQNKLMKLFQENIIEKNFGDEFLKRDKIAVDDILSGKITVEFSGTPS